MGGEKEKSRRWMWRAWACMIFYFLFIVLFLRGVELKIRWEYSVFVVVLLFSITLLHLTRVYLGGDINILRGERNVGGRMNASVGDQYWSLLRSFIYWSSLILSFLLLFPFAIVERMGATSRSILISVALVMGIGVLLISRVNVLSKFIGVLRGRSIDEREKRRITRGVLYAHVLLILSFLLDIIAFTYLFYFFGFSSQSKSELALLYSLSLLLSFISPFEGGIGMREFIFSVLCFFYFRDVSFYAFTIFSYSLLYVMFFIILSFFFKKIKKIHREHPL